MKFTGCFGILILVCLLSAVQPVRALEGAVRIDDPSTVISVDGNYELFVNHGSCRSSNRGTYHIHVGRSPKITGPYPARQRRGAAAFKRR